ncbi:ankyrin repeat protein [Aspergillus mulundensis]|uniref:Uncharacterized protein n=1 Tax=Aspergillus mulundensis TaxID=1810919 RepID=A0A3D8SC85_9EURO|nr:hypothetical protein DSM5745_04285 [Aspergillus mulundensis]RDW83959.1 hypothetical protein DSM5745_04285 [Aspergillus mulundensis]
MDPLSAVGLISGSFPVGHVISETLAGLASLREKYQHADLTIEALEKELGTIKAAITHLEVWTRARLRESPAEYRSTLEVALDGCRTVMEALSDEVLVLTQSASPNEAGVGFRTRIRVLWREDVMRGHQERLRSQLIALQLLVRACQCQYSAEQVELLRKAESRHIIRKVADDAATLRSSTRCAGSRADTASRLSQHESTAGDTVFEFDRTLAATLLYQRVPQLLYSKPETRSATSNGNHSRMTDEGYGRAGLTDGSIHTWRRQHDRDINTSIDLTSAEGAGNHLIVKIAQTSSWTDMEKLIERGCDLEAKHLPTRRTALHVAAHCGNEAVVEILIRKNPRLDAVDKSGSTALHLAASRGHCRVLESLILSELIDIEARDSRGRTALLVNARADTQMTALPIAAKQGDDAIVKLLVNADADLEAKDGTLMTVLHYASEKDHKDTTYMCCRCWWTFNNRVASKKKSLESMRRRCRMTAMHWAAYNGHTEVMEILSSRKSSLTALNFVKRTALHLAAMNAQFAVVELLLRKQVPVETKCQSGLTALHYACLANSIEISRLLLMSGADVEAQMDDGMQRRPVHIATNQNSIGLLNLLCDKRATIEEFSRLQSSWSCML